MVAPWRFEVDDQLESGRLLYGEVRPVSRADNLSLPSRERRLDYPHPR
jgi:hypothetical protein